MPSAFCLLIATLPDIVLRVSTSSVSQFFVMAFRALHWLHLLYCSYEVLFPCLCNIIHLLSIYPCAGMDTKNIIPVLASVLHSSLHVDAPLRLDICRILLLIWNIPGLVLPLFKMRRSHGQVRVRSSSFVSSAFSLSILTNARLSADD